LFGRRVASKRRQLGTEGSGLIERSLHRRGGGGGGGGAWEKKKKAVIFT